MTRYLKPFLITVLTWATISADAQDDPPRLHYTIMDLDLSIASGGHDLGIGPYNRPLGASPVDPPYKELPEEDEEGKGAFVLVNWDDDNEDGKMTQDGEWTSLPIPDLTQGYVPGENNLGRMKFSIKPRLGKGNIELKVTQGSSKIRLWEDDEKFGNSFPMTKEWDLENPLEDYDFVSRGKQGVFIEGYEASNEKQVHIELTYELNGRTIYDRAHTTVVMLNLGNAVYRELASSVSTLASRGHAAIVIYFNGELTKENLKEEKNYYVVQMVKGRGITYDPLTSITNYSGTYYFDSYTNPSITQVQRLQAITLADSLTNFKRGYEIGYGGAIGFELIQPESWDGKLGSITDLRCDGIVELAYEMHGVPVWGMWREGNPANIHYDVSDLSDTLHYDPVAGVWVNVGNWQPDALEEHNDFDIASWGDTLMPATQSGYTAPVSSQTKMIQQDLGDPIGP